MAFSARDIANFIPDFDGSQTTLHDFVSACDHAIKYIDPENEAHIPFLIKSKLIGEAKQFISSRALTNWSDIRNLLLSHFGDTRDAESLLRELTTSFQKQSENPRSYVQRVQLLLTKLRNCTALDDTLDKNTKMAMNDKHERIGLKTILSGLNDPIGQILRSQRPQTIEDATSILAEEENLQFLKSFRNMNVRNNFQTPSQIIPKNFKDNKIITKHCSFCNKPGHTTNECYRKNNGNIQTPNANAYKNGAMQPLPSRREASEPIEQRNVLQQNRPSVIKKNFNLNYLGGNEEVDSFHSQIDSDTMTDTTDHEETSDMEINTLSQQ